MGLLPNINSPSSKQNRRPKTDLKMLKQLAGIANLRHISQPNLIIESGVHPSLHPNCHHQIIPAKFNLQIYYPPQYCSEVWHYNAANTEFIRLEVDRFNRQKAFMHKKLNEQGNIFNGVIVNVLEILYRMKPYYVMTEIHRGLTKN